METEKKKKFKKIVKTGLSIAGLALIGYGVYKYTSLRKELVKEVTRNEDLNKEVRRLTYTTGKLVGKLVTKRK